jgi:hypothetical protein
LRLRDTCGSEECHELPDEFDAWRITLDLGRVDDHLVYEGTCGFDRLWVIATRQGGLQVVHACGIGPSDVGMERGRGYRGWAVWIAQLVTQRLKFGEFGHDRRARAPVANRVDQIVDLAIERSPLALARLDCRDSIVALASPATRSRSWL